MLTPQAEEISPRKGFTIQNAVNLTVSLEIMLEEERTFSFQQITDLL